MEGLHASTARHRTTAGDAASPRAAGRRRPLVRLAVLAVALALGLVAAEGLIRTLSKHALVILDVEMWRYARLVKAPSERPGLVEEHRPGAEALLMGVEVRTDDHGFRRASPAVEAARRPGERLVAAIGDSLTFGWGVPEDRTFPAQLETLLRQRCPDQPPTVVNAGVGNSNTAMQLARYDLLVAPREPEWVIVGYFVNDAEPDPEPAENPLLWRSSLAALLAARLAQGRHEELRDYREYYAELYQEDRAGWRRTRRALRDFGRRLAADGVAGTLLLLPEMHRPRGHGPFAEEYARVAAIGGAAGFEVIDTAPRFPAGSGERFWVSPTDAHPDGDAQELFARALLESRHACPAG